jgi:uncharacterized RDD family membrane protein YckC
MRCPKCHYISFEDADRCRNCGYDFSLSDVQPKPAAELPLNDREADPLPPVDLSLSQVEGLRESRKPDTPIAFDLDRIPDAPRAAATPIDLPLFKSHTGAARESVPSSVRRESVDRLEEDDAPLVKPRAVPRAPVAVRRATPDSNRLRSRYPLADVPTLALEPAAPAGDAGFEQDDEVEVALPPSTLTVRPAPAGRRILAALIDLAIVLGIDVAVLYFTLKLCELPLTTAGVLELPIVPAAVFILMLDAGYAIAFTAAIGQTIGKMATGLKVLHVRDDDLDDGQPNFGFAILRTAAYVASALPAGLGFLPGLVGRDRRALHDRLAETRVVYWGQM